MHISKAQLSPKYEPQSSLSGFFRFENVIFRTSRFFLSPRRGSYNKSCPTKCSVQDAHIARMGHGIVIQQTALGRPRFILLDRASKSFPPPILGDTEKKAKSLGAHRHCRACRPHIIIARWPTIGLCTTKVSARSPHY